MSWYDRGPEPDERLAVAVYDRFWQTAGGGEKYAGGLADVLSADHDVTLVAHEPIDTEVLGERLALDLSRVSVTVVDECEPLEQTTAGFDLLVNASYRSHGRNGARRGVYVVHFPDQPTAGMARWQRLVAGPLGAPFRRRGAEVTFEHGFHEPDVIRWQQVRWTNGEGVIRIGIQAGQETTLHLRFGRFVPGDVERTIAVSVDGVIRAREVLRPPRSRLQVLEPLDVSIPVVGRRGGNRVTIHSSVSVPHDISGNGDRRRLGVPLVGLAVGSGLDAVSSRASLLLAGPPDVAWLDSYDVVVSNSAFTQRWVRRWWGRESEVLAPPVRLRSRLSKEPVILSVGRFFAPGRGHAKKQLEMVEAFARVHEQVATEWELHLVGGCDPVDHRYLQRVRDAARGLPVHLHVDASGHELEELYGKASIYWHATGLGEDLDADPTSAEHFGITTVEAMSAGAVPVVIDAGGQPEIVADGVDGLLFRTAEELVDRTVSLIGDPSRRAELAAAAERSARRFGLPAFAHRLQGIVEGLFPPSGGTSGVPPRREDP